MSCRGLSDKTFLAFQFSFKFQNFIITCKPPNSVMVFLCSSSKDNFIKAATAGPGPWSRSAGALRCDWYFSIFPLKTASLCARTISISRRTRTSLRPRLSPAPEFMILWRARPNQIKRDNCQSYVKTCHSVKICHNMSRCVIICRDIW